MLQLFELMEQLEAGRTAQARLLVWDGKSYVPSRKVVTLFDYVGSHGLPGDRGYCFQSGMSQHWEVVSGLSPHVYRQML
jgi:hypothetical protein